MRVPSLAVASLTAALVLGGCSAATRPDGGVGLLPVGKDAPELSATDQEGLTRRISEGRGHPLVVYFYPKDGTPGCTREACAFRDAWARFQKAGVQIFGVSADDRASHETFAREQKLPFPIVADPTHTWSDAFGVGTRLGMPARVTFLIDPAGRIAKVYPHVDPGVHADQVLQDAAALAPGPAIAR